jgi:hypothetical protein
LGKRRNSDELEAALEQQLDLALKACGGNLEHAEVLSQR